MDGAFDSKAWIESTEQCSDLQSRAFGKQAKVLYEEIAKKSSSDPQRVALALSKATRAYRASNRYSVELAKMERREARAWEAVGDASKAAGAFERAGIIFADFYGEGDSKAKHMRNSARRVDPSGALLAEQAHQARQTNGDTLLSLSIPVP